MLSPFVRLDPLPARALIRSNCSRSARSTPASCTCSLRCNPEAPHGGDRRVSFIYAVVAIIVDRVAFGQRLASVQVPGAALILLAAADADLGWRLVPQRRYSST